ncbi:hypothetical protein RND81_13G138400 [Saponaria officinalis]|uniref:Uncharacterized protein n=1 Tax=Saponaria officinalis TaxID=3572 RepID=A0AAW1H667_SAPOF
MFYGCPLRPKNSCGFFVLVNDLGADATSSHHCNKVCCEDQVLKLKTKNKKLKKELWELRIELKKTFQGGEGGFDWFNFLMDFFCIMLDGEEKLMYFWSVVGGLSCNLE